MVGIWGDPATYYFFNHVGAAPNPILAPTIPVSIYSMFQVGRQALLGQGRAHKLALLRVGEYKCYCSIFVSIDFRIVTNAGMGMGVGSDLLSLYWSQ